jgi:hypothetical protein
MSFDHVQDGVGLGEDFFWGFGFGEDESDAGALGLVGDDGGRVHGEKDDGGVGEDDAQLGCSFQAVHYGHGKVEDDQVRSEFSCEVDGFLAVAGFAADGEAVGEEERLELAADGGIVVDDEDRLAVLFRDFGDEFQLSSVN